MRILYIGKKELFLLTLILIAALVIAYSLLDFFPGKGQEESLNASAAPYYQGSEGRNCISLTINVDWGEEFIPDILKILENEEVKATFFLTGRWTEKNPALALQIAQAGHEIGNHAYSHQSPNQAGYDGNCEEIQKTSQAILQATGLKTVLYAPPSGEREDVVLKAAEDMGHTVILWSVDTIDWQRPDASVILERVIKKIHPGAIILAHPTNPTLHALPEIISGLKNMGYEFVTVSQNLGL